jgi:hypothetical protein
MGEPFHEPVVHASVVSAVRTAFARSRTSPSTWKHRQNEGRVDPRSVWRQEATNRTDIFRDRTAPGATKVNVHILVDGSGSMSSKDQKDLDGNVTSRINAAMDVTATLADAFRRQPQVRLNVWLHNTVGEQGGEVAVFPIITEGRGRENVAYMGMAVGGGNGDGYAIKWVGDKVRRGHRKGEVDLLIVVSDGLPSYLSPAVYDHWDPVTGTYRNSGVALVFNAVQELRDQHTSVLSVAIAPNPNQEEMFGEDGVVPFTGDWGELAVNIGSLLGRTLLSATKDRRR